MKNFRGVWCGAAVLAMAWGGGAARGQFQDVPLAPAPGISPYLNLFRPGSNPALNYFNLVQPQLQTQANFQQLQQQQQVIRQQLNQTAAPAGGGQGTPKVPGYMTHGKYFFSGGAIAAGTGKAHKSLSDRQVNTTPAQNQAQSLTGNANPANQTRTIVPANNNLSQPFAPNLTPIFNPAAPPFNPYRGF